MKKITVIAVIPGQKVHGENIVFPVSSAVKSIVLKEDTDVYISWFTEGDLMQLSWINESIHKEYWDNLKDYLLNSECNLLYLEPVDVCKKLQTEFEDDVSFEVLMRNSYFYEIERYEAISKKIMSAIDTTNDIVIVMYYSLAALFYLQNKNSLDITYLEDTAPPSGSFHTECYLQEMVMERYLSVKTIGEFLIAKGDEKPDYLGSWDTENNGEFKLYITGTKNKKSFGVIVDNNGYATFDEGNFSDKSITFIKKYSDESIGRTLAIPVPINYNFSTNDAFLSESLGKYSYIYGEGHYDGTAVIKKNI